jgi:selenocysteine lyase/cysteine desulfurase
MVSPVVTPRWCPSDTAAFDELRRREFARLDRAKQVYLDYTGGALYAESQVRDHAAVLAGGVFGNPHSYSPSSIAATESVERARARVLEFFRASPDEYVVIFTHNATSALKLVGEAYPFSGGRLLMTYDNHNSVNGLREFARRRGAAVRYVPITVPELRVDEAQLAGELGRARPGRNQLFAFPAQSNFSGVQHPLAYIELAQRAGWDVIVDCATFAPTNRLDLSKWHPDFVPLSFYKMFGYPTGIGCLIARRAALAKLRRPWFSGGTVWGVSVSADYHVLLDGGQAFEDGTIDYLGIPAVEIGLGFLARIGIDRIHDHVTALGDAMVRELTALRHATGRRLVEIHGPAGGALRGATFALGFHDPDGAPIDERIIERTAHAAGISLRTGCFCNPGGFEAAWGLSRSRLRALRPTGWQFVKTLFGSARSAPPTMQDYVDKLGLPTAGATRVSLGLASNAADVAAFVNYARTFLDTRPDGTGLRPRHGC